jgi:hypothetical protein
MKLYLQNRAGEPAESISRDLFLELLWLARHHGWQARKVFLNEQEWRWEVLFKSYLPPATVYPADAESLHEALIQFSRNVNDQENPEFVAGFNALLRVSGQGIFTVTAQPIWVVEPVFSASRESALSVA